MIGAGSEVGAVWMITFGLPLSSNARAASINIADTHAGWAICPTHPPFPHAEGIAVLSHL